MRTQRAQVRTDDRFGPERYGPTIKRIRKAAGLTLEQVAEEIDVSDGFLSMLERGVRRGSIETYCDLARLFGVELGEVFRVIDPDMPKPLIRFLQTLEEDGEALPGDDELEYLRLVAVPGRTMTRAAYGHALALYRATKKTES